MVQKLWRQIYRDNFAQIRDFVGLFWLFWRATSIILDSFVKGFVNVTSHDAVQIVDIFTMIQENILT